MFTYRQLILAVTILSAKIIFADILVPSYKHAYSNNPAYLQSQSIPDYKMSSAVEQYAKQLAAQHLKQHPSEVQTVHPSYYQNKVQSNLVAYPRHSLYHYPYHHHVSRPSGKLRYVKLGGHEYVRPSVFIGYPNTLAVHYRRKRSTDFTGAKSDKPAVATHDVAANPTLIDTKYPTAIDSLLPENESTNINDKHVKNRRREANFATKPFLFGLDPNKMYSELKAKNLDSKEDETQHSLSKRHPATLITPVVLTQKFTPDSAKTTATEPAQRMLSTNQEKRQNQEASSTHHENPRPTPNVSSTTKTLEQSSSPITTSQKQSSEEESHKDYSEYYNNYGSTYAYTLPTMSLRYPVPLTYRYWPTYIKYNAEISPSNKKEYPHQQDASNHPIIQQTSNQASSQETTTVGATNTAQPRHDQTHVYLCPEGVPCPTGNMGTNKLSSEAAPSMPTTTAASCVTCTRYRSNEEPSRREIISAPNPGTPQVFYITPDDYTNYYSGEYIKDYQDNLGADYQDYDYDEEPTYYTDGFHMYIKENSAYSSNVPSNKIYDNTLYANINAQSNVAPMTYVAVVSSDVPQVQEPLLGAYYYPTKKTYASYKPHDYNYYKYYYNYHNTIDRYSNYRNLPNVFYRAISSPVYY